MLAVTVWKSLREISCDTRPHLCPLPQGEDFSLEHFLIIWPPVRPIQRLDSRKRRQPFPLLLGGEGRDEGERFHHYFLSSPTVFGLSGSGLGVQLCNTEAPQEN